MTTLKRLLASIAAALTFAALTTDPRRRASALAEADRLYAATRRYVTRGRE